MRVVQDDRMGMAWSRRNEVYENDCVQAVLANMVRMAKTKNSYLFSGSKLTFLEELEESREKSPSLESIRGEDSRFDATRSSPVISQQEVPQLTAHQEHELGRKVLCMDNTVKEPGNGGVRDTQYQRSKGINSPHQKASGEIKDGTSPQLVYDTQAGNTGKTSTPNSSLAKQGHAKGIAPLQAKRTVSGEMASKNHTLTRDLETKGKFKEHHGGNDIQHMPHQHNQRNHHYPTPQWNDFRERKVYRPFNEPNFTREQRTGKPHSFVDKHYHPVKAKGIASGAMSSPSQNKTSAPMPLDASTRPQKPMPQNLADPRANPGFVGTENKRPKREHRLSASMNNMYDRTKNNVNPNTVKKAPSKTTDIEPQVVVIKIEEDDCFNITTDPVKHMSVIKRYPYLLKVIPSIGGSEISLQWSHNAVFLVLRYLFEPQYDFQPLPKGRIIIEALAAALEWGVADFRTRIQPLLVQELLSQQNAAEFYNLADHFGDRQLCAAIKDGSKCLSDSLSGEGTLPRKLTAARFRTKSCVISCQFYVDPLEFSIPLVPGSNSLLEENKRDMQCHILFQSMLGTFAISGFQMSFLCIANGDNVWNANKLKIDYQLENLDHPCSVTDIKEKPLRPKVILHLKKDFVVRQGEKCKLSIETELSPITCYVPQASAFVHSSEKGKFQLSLSSNYKAKSDERERFFIEKLFYREL